MMKLSEKYSTRPPGELPMLFQRILQNTIRDYFRRQKVRSLWTTQISSLSTSEDEDHDPLETLERRLTPTAEAVLPTPCSRLKHLKLLRKHCVSCLSVNVRPSSCVTGRKWMLPKRRP
jgi:DNA-directed RNA polymerase specialized sigma24 family protein